MPHGSQPAGAQLHVPGEDEKFDPLNASLALLPPDPAQVDKTISGEHIKASSINSISHGDQRRGLWLLYSGLVIMSAVLLILFLHLIFLQSDVISAGLSFVLFVVGLASITLTIVGCWRVSRQLTKVEDERDRQRIDKVLSLSRDEAQLHRSVVDMLGDIVIRRGRDGIIHYVNEAFASVFGGKSADYVGQTLNLDVLDVQPGADLTVSGDRLIRDLLIETPQGPRWFIWIDAPVFPSHDAAPILQSIARDITARKGVEKELRETSARARAANRSKSGFLAMVSHEIRTPLNGIIGMSKLMSDMPLSSEQATYVQAINGSGEALLTLINDLLDFSKIEAGRIELDPVPTRVTALIEEIVELLTPRAHEKGLEIASYVGPAVPDEIEVDAMRLRQILLNLAGNAIKFTERGGIALIVTAAECRSSNQSEKALALTADYQAQRTNEDTIRFEVVDTGIGLSKEDQSRIFDEFEQAESGRARRFSGTGLGLTISQRIVQKMGGLIQVKSVLSAGSTFWFEFQHKGAPPVASGHDLTKAQPTKPDDFTDCHVLICSSAELEADLIRRMLEDRGADVRRVKDREAALAMLASVPVDVAFIDADIEDGDQIPVSFENNKLGQSQVPRWSYLLRPKQRAERGAACPKGFDSYLIKPIRQQSLAMVMRKMWQQAVPHEAEAFDSQAVETKSDTFLPKDDAAPLRSKRQKKRILIAEDNDINALLTTALLERDGHSVVRVADGKAARDLLIDSQSQDGDRKAAFDCAFMDLHMPGLDGVAAIEAVRVTEREKGVASLPIYVLTADTLPETVARARNAGAMDILQKPLNPDRLRDVLSELPEG